MKQHQIKLVIFDGYGPILSNGYPDTVAFLAKKFKNISRERMYEVIYKKYFNQAAERKITQKQAWQLAVKELDLPLTWQELWQIHLGLFKLNRPVLKIAQKVQKRYKTLLLSKNTRSQLAACKKKFPVIWQSFDAVINTWELGLPKASQKTILEICRRFKVKPTEILFIDDQEANLIEPQKMGVKTILYRNPKQFKKDFEKYIKL